MPRVLVRLGGRHRTAQTQGLVNDRSLLLTVIEAGGSKVTVPAYSVSNEKPSWFGDGGLCSGCVLTRQKGATELFGLAFIRDVLLLISQRPHIPSHWGIQRGVGETEILVCFFLH